MTYRDKWLEPFSWDFVTAQNQILCANKSAHHGPTSDGHDLGKELWQTNCQQEISLFEAVEICRKCHKIAPFTNYNGNTFAAIARIMIKKLDLKPEDEFLIRSLAGHIVAGVAGEDELKAFEQFCKSLG